MLLRPLPILPCLARLGSACAAPIQVFHDFDPDYAFGQVQTYAWADQRDAGSPETRSDLLRRRVQSAVDAELSPDGLRKAASPEQADVMVLWYAGIKEKIDLRQIDYTRSSPIPERTVEVYDQGTLIVDIVEREQGQLLWRGRAEARVDTASSPEERAERIREAAAKMFERYPPG